MKTLRTLAVVGALLAAATGLPGCAVAQPQPVYDPGAYGYGGDAVPYAWQQQLSPYGSWQYAAPYGYVWAPRVAAGWLPYQYGYWGWGPAGWVWFSDEPWGFTFHYGRWVAAPFGWAWVPGYTWGPAWVQWYWGAGYVGWAPLGWYGVVPWNHYVFVHDGDFACHRVQHVVVHKPHIHYDQLFRERKLERRPPPHDYIRRVSDAPMTQVTQRRPPSTLAPGMGGRGRGTDVGRPGGTPPAIGTRPPVSRGVPRGFTSTPIPSTRPGSTPPIPERAPPGFQTPPPPSARPGASPRGFQSSPLPSGEQGAPPPAVGFPDRPMGSWTTAPRPRVVPSPAPRPMPAPRPAPVPQARPAPTAEPAPAPPPRGHEQPGMSGSPFGQSPGGFLQPQGMAPAPRGGFMGGGRGGGPAGGFHSPGGR